MALLAKGSTPAVGSSRITVRDPAAKAIATESFLFMPPLNVSTAQCLFVGSPTSITSLLGKKGGRVCFILSFLVGGSFPHTRGGFRIYFE